MISRVTILSIDFLDTATDVRQLKTFWKEVDVTEAGDGWYYGLPCRAHVPSDPSHSKWLSRMVTFLDSVFSVLHELLRSLMHTASLFPPVPLPLSYGRLES